MLAPALAAVLLLTGCGPFGNDDDPGAKTLAEQLAGGLSAGDISTVAFTTPEAVAEYTALSAPLKSLTSEVSVEDVVSTEGDDSDGNPRAVATLTWNSRRDAIEWGHQGTVNLVKQDGAWQAVWAPAILESSLVEGETLAVSGIKATRGNIVGAQDKALVQPRAVIRFGIDKTQLDGADAAASARSLATALDVDVDAFVKQVNKAGPKAFVQALVLRRSDASDDLLARVNAIDAARSISDKLPLAPTKDFAAALLGTVGPATAELIAKSEGRLRAGDDTGLSGLQARYDEQLSGTSGLKVSALPDSDSDPDSGGGPRVLFEQQPIPGEPLALSLDLSLQSTAQKLLTSYGPASALVAIKPSTGEILAAASGPGSDGYNTATFGQYPPGSTFKVVSALALLRSGLKPESTVDCPATTVVNGKSFKNYSDYPSNRLGRITLREAVANSCNTAFISERSKLEGTVLADAAAALGFGVDYDVGFPAYFGQVPTPEGETEAAADLIGQGKILASPMAMATVMASVVRGSAVVPDLIRDDEVVSASPAAPLTGGEAKNLRTLLGAVVTEGSGSFLQSLGTPAVLAKTGTAEYGDATKTHAWMIGAQGDLAVAVFVETGQSGSQTAGPVLADFLRAAK